MNCVMADDPPTGRRGVLPLWPGGGAGRIRGAIMGAPASQHSVLMAARRSPKTGKAAGTG